MRNARPALSVALALFALAEVRCTGDAPVESTAPDAATEIDSGSTSSSSSSGSTNPPRAFGAVKQLVAGDAFSCARSEAGDVRCWGSNEFGQLGQNSGSPSRSDVAANSTIDFGVADPVVELAASYNTVCALFQTGQVRCWGFNSTGERGAGNTDHKGLSAGDMLRIDPVELGQDRAATHIYAGLRHFCVTLRVGGVVCWGFGQETNNGRFGWLGNGGGGNVGDQPGEMGANLIPLDLPEETVEMALGFTVSCARSVSNAVRCWGLHRAGQLGSGSVQNDAALDVKGSLAGLAPVATDVLSLFGRGPALAAKRSDGSLVTWDQNDHGQQGFGNVADVGTPTALPTKAQVRVLRSGSRHRCFVQVDGELYCLGNNDYGQLGYGDSSKRGDAAGGMPTELAPVLTGISDVAVGGEHTCALKNDGGVVCFGRNTSGQLGYGDDQTRGANEATVPSVLPAVPGL